SAPMANTELVVGGNIYFDAASMRKVFASAPGLASGQLPGDPLTKVLASPKIKWIEISGVAKALGAMPSPFGTNPDPSDLVHSLEAHGVHVTEVGTTTINGVA